MKIPMPTVSRWVFVVGSLIASPTTNYLYGQTPVRGMGREGATARALDVSDARALVSVGDLAGAENILSESNFHKGNGAKAKFERSFKLAGLAFSFANLNDRTRAKAVASLAITRLREAAVECANERLNNTAARSLELIGKLEEVIFGNQKAAIQAYESALTFNPTSSTAVQAIARKTAEEAAFEKTKLKRGGK
jgi:hypothetical protein